MHESRPPNAVLRALAPALLILLLAVSPVRADDPPAAGNWGSELRANVWDPWFIFGMVAQGVFFLRFIVQWIVSEKRKRSTIPIAFWYLSLVGGVATFVYAVHEAQPVFMLGQALACGIYVRNLMLIYGRARRLRDAGGPAAEPLDPGRADLTEEGP